MVVERVINLLGILVLLSERQRRAHIDQVMRCARLVASWRLHCPRDVKLQECLAKLDVYVCCNVIRNLLYTVDIRWRFILRLYLGKGRHVLNAWTFPEGSMKMKRPHFKTIGTWRW